MVPMRLNRCCLSRRQYTSMTMLCSAVMLLLACTAFSASSTVAFSTTSTSTSLSMSSSVPAVPPTNSFEKKSRGRLLILGGSGFLGSAVATKAVLEGYAVTSLSRRGAPSKVADDEDVNAPLAAVDYRTGDARERAVLTSLLREYDDYVAVVHCIGLLLDGESRLGTLNRFVSGSGSVPESGSTYDDITRVTAFAAIEATEECLADDDNDNDNDNTKVPFLFTSAAEAGWPDVRGGGLVENTLAPKWLRRYLAAKRSVEERLRYSRTLRPVIFRPSLIYSLDRLRSLPPVSAFYLGNKVGLPFVDRPVTVQALANAFIKSVGDDTVQGVQRYREIDRLNQ